PLTSIFKASATRCFAMSPVRPIAIARTNFNKEMAMSIKNIPNAELNAQSTTAETQAPAPDPFDPTNLRLSQSFVETAGVKKLTTTVPVRKPGQQDFVRVHADPSFRDNFPIIELKDEREEYIVTADLVPALVGEFVTKTLFTAINRQG